MTLARALQVAAGNSQETGDVAEAIDFDTTNDYLSRSSDLIGNTDGKTFTFSGWVWRSSSDGIFFIDTYRASPLLRNSLQVQNDGNFQVSFYNASGTRLMNVTATAVVPLNTFTHILFSVDLNSTSNRYLYVNDVAVSPTWTTYVNDVIDFTVPSFHVGSAYTGGANEGRLSNVFLDYTYRDLSIEANRRLFITADLKPAAGQASLNPILYLPLNDPTAPGVNAGTGGNFTLTGTVARSGRGPNQYNAPYSDLDGTADYLSTTSVTGIADGKQLTVSFCGNIDTFTTGNVLAFSTTSYFRVYFGSNAINITALNSAGSTILSASYSIGSAVNRNYSIQISCDLSDTNKRHMIVNGQAVAATWSTYTNDNIDFTHTTYQVGRYSTNQYLNGRLGALWFNTSYIDLSVPDNLAKFVTGTGIDAKPVDLGANGELPTGTSPLIYLPMYGNNAGKNYGTGGDFTVNSGPYTGARGPNEFWGNKAVSDGTTGFLSRAALAGVSDSKTLSFVCWFFYDGNAGKYLFNQYISTGSLRGFNCSIENSNRVVVQGRNSAGTVVFNSDNTAASMITSGFNCLMVSLDLTDSGKTRVFVNNTSATLNVFTFTNDFVNTSSSSNFILRSVFSSAYNNQPISELYFTTDYIDFSQEANRLKFRDAFGNPVDLTQQIEDGAIPNPAIYMRFPPTAFGTNYGTGGNFTVNGTISDGGQL